MRDSFSSPLRGPVHYDIWEQLAPLQCVTHLQATPSRRLSIAHLDFGGNKRRRTTPAPRLSPTAGPLRISQAHPEAISAFFMVKIPSLTAGTKAQAFTTVLVRLSAFARHRVAACKLSRSKQPLPSIRTSPVTTETSLFRSLAPIHLPRRLIRTLDR